MQSQIQNFVQKVPIKLSHTTLNILDTFCLNKFPCNGIYHYPIERSWGTVAISPHHLHKWFFLYCCKKQIKPGHYLFRSKEYVDGIGARCFDRHRGAILGAVKFDDVTHALGTHDKSLTQVQNIHNL